LDSPAIQKRLSLVGLHFEIVLIFMQDGEVDSISSDDAVGDPTNRLARFAVPVTVLPFWHRTKTSAPPEDQRPLRSARSWD
jgi:hypothetical protein